MLSDDGCQNAENQLGQNLLYKLLNLKNEQSAANLIAVTVKHRLIVFVKKICRRMVDAGQNNNG